MKGGIRFTKGCLTVAFAEGPGKTTYTWIRFTAGEPIGRGTGVACRRCPRQYRKALGGVRMSQYSQVQSGTPCFHT